MFILVLIVASLRGRQRWDDRHRVQPQTYIFAPTVIKVCRTDVETPAVPGVVVGLVREAHP